MTAKVARILSGIRREAERQANQGNVKGELVVRAFGWGLMGVDVGLPTHIPEASQAFQEGQKVKGLLEMQ